MNTRLLFCLLWLTPLLCQGASFTSYFYNVEALTNSSARQELRGNAAVVTNSVLVKSLTNVFDQAVQTLYYTPTRVVFDGDSLTSSNGAYATYFQSLYLPTFSASVVSNVAVSGQTMWDMLYSRYTNYVQPNKPASGTNALLFAWGGINDIFYNTNSTATVIATISNYWAQAKADGFTLVAFTVTDRGNFPSSTNQYERQFVNSFIRSSDLWDYLVDVDAKYPVASTMWHLSDLVHFTTNSARAIADLAASSVFGPKNNSPLVAQPFGYNYIGTNYFGSGSAALPTIAFSIDPTTGIARASTGTIGFTTGGNGRAILSSSHFRVSSGIQINWSSSAAWTDVGDIGLTRNSAGILRVSDASTGMGALLYTRQVLPKTGAYSVVATNSNAVISNEGASALQINTLPAAVAGLTVTFVIQDGDGLEVLAVGDDTIRIAGSVTGAAGNIQATTIGNTVTLCAINATEWVALSHEGTWTLSP